MNNYEKLREIIYKEKYPDGIPLEFGCEVLVRGKHPDMCISPCVDPDRRVQLLNTGYIHCHQLDNLGRPLTLATISPYVKDKHFLIDNWIGELAKEQTDELLQWCINNVVNHKN